MNIVRILTKVIRTIAEDLMSIGDGALVFHATMVTRTLSAFSHAFCNPAVSREAGTAGHVKTKNCRCH